jgi:hypothetical protein
MIPREPIHPKLARQLEREEETPAQAILAFLACCALMAEALVLVMMFQP